MNKQIYNLLEKCREEIENLYGRDTDLTDEITEMMDKFENQLTNGWMPCKEMLPEKRKEVLVEIKLNGYYSIVIGSYCIVNGKWEIGNDVMGYDWDEDMVDEVIAWQPLPPKYEEVIVNGTR